MKKLAINLFWASTIIIPLAIPILFRNDIRRILSYDGIREMLIGSALTLITIFLVYTTVGECKRKL